MRQAARLKVIRETTDGFRIAEEDLRLRGEGEVLGTRQSGLPGYRIARPEVHAQLIAQARDEAVRIMQDNPKLKGERGEALRAVLRAGDVLVTMGAGSISAVSHALSGKLGAAAARRQA